MKHVKQRHFLFKTASRETEMFPKIFYFPLSASVIFFPAYEAWLIKRRTRLEARLCYYPNFLPAITRTGYSLNTLSFHLQPENYFKLV